MEEDIGNEKEIQEDRERRYGGIQSERNGWRKKRKRDSEMLLLFTWH